MQQGRLDLFETSSDGSGLARSPWRASAALGLLLLSLTACAGVTGSESAEDLEEREAEAKAEEQGNPTD